MVASYTKLLAKRYKGKLDSDADEFIGFAVDGATRMQLLIHDLLLFSRVGSQGLNLEETSSQTLLERATQNLRVSIEESGATITHDQLPTLSADNIKLGQVFQNLVGNALKFRGSKPVRVHIAAEDKGAEWQFSVRDNGIGIDLKYVDRIFVVFQRLHTKEEYAGTGIGLALCKKIIEMHGGRIWFESTAGEGPNFLFTLPKGTIAHV